MTYAVAAALQAAVFARLSADTGVSAQVGTAIYDAVPPGDAPATFVIIGPEDVRDRSDASGSGAEHRLTVSVMSSQSGFMAAKSVAGAISEALADADLPLSRGRLVGIGFVQAVAKATADGQGRRIDLTFRARVEG